MLAKLVFLVLLTENVLRITHGQSEEKFFRRDYTYIDDTHSFYKVHTLHKNWKEAKAKCEVEGATLFYPEDDDEALAVISHWNATQPLFHWVYIGVADWNVKEVFETIDGRPLSDVYDNWGVEEPNNADNMEGCVILRRDGTLNDDNCNHKYPFVCKKSLATLQWNPQCHVPDQNYVYNAKQDRCYKFHLKPRNWTDAHSVCNAEQSYLADINSEAERAHLVELTAKAPKETVFGDYLRGGVHLGFQKTPEGWMSIKGVPLEENGYSRWAYRQPDGGDTEDCGSMFYTGELNDISCSQKMFFICEHDIPLRATEVGYKFGEGEKDEEKSKNITKLPDLSFIFGPPPPSSV